MKKTDFLYRITAAVASAAVALSLTVCAGAWSEDPGDAETTTAATTTTAQTTIPLGGDRWDTDAETTTTTTEIPDAVLEDDVIAEEDDEEIFSEDIEAEIDDEVAEVPEEEPEPAVTEAPAATTTAAAATTAAAPLNTAAPDSYQAVEPFKMYVPEVLNVRGGPGTDYDKLGQVYANNTISIIGTSGDWYVFDYYGVDGYLLSSLLSEVPDSAETTVTTPETDTTLPPVDDGGEIETEDDAIIEDEPVETDETVAEPEETDAPIAPEETTEEAPAAAAPVDGGNAGGMPPVLLALICAAATFLLIGVVPVLIHRSHHKKLYQY